MRKRSTHSKEQEPSLVPLADMLTNTVGILFFILIFTVLATGGVVVTKRLPMEQSTDAKPLEFFCSDGRIVPLDANLMGRFLNPLGQLTSFDEVENWVKKFNERTIENDFFVVTGKGEAVYSGNYFSRRTARLILSLHYSWKEGTGEIDSEVQEPSSQFRKILKEHDHKKWFVNFNVHPTCINLFETTRSLAMEMEYKTGWTPMSKNTVVFNIAGPSGTGTPSRPQ